MSFKTSLKIKLPTKYSLKNCIYVSIYIYIYIQYLASHNPHGFLCQKRPTTKPPNQATIQSTTCALSARLFPYLQQFR